MLFETVRGVKMDVMRDVDAKTVVPYLPLLEIFRSARMRESTMQMAPTWKELRR